MYTFQFGQPTQAHISGDREENSETSEGQTCASASPAIITITVAHLSGALALLLSKDNVNYTPLELAAVHRFLGVLCFIVVDEFHKAEGLGPPVAGRKRAHTKQNTMKLVLSDAGQHLAVTINLPIFSPAQDG
jgi:hypothetical protein